MRIQGFFVWHIDCKWFFTNLGAENTHKNDINRVFGKWFNGDHLRGDEVEFIIYNIILLVLVIACVILVARIAYLCQ